MLPLVDRRGPRVGMTRTVRLSDAGEAIRWFEVVRLVDLRRYLCRPTKARPTS